MKMTEEKDRKAYYIYINAPHYQKLDNVKEVTGADHSELWNRLLELFFQKVTDEELERYIIEQRHKELMAKVGIEEKKTKPKE
jgi:hypothetical protein